MSGPPTAWSRRSLLAVFARRAALHSSPRALLRSVARSLGQAVVVALLAAPFAAAWGLGHADIDDYLGPHQVNFASNYQGEVTIDLFGFLTTEPNAEVGPIHPQSPSRNGCGMIA